MPAVGLGAEDLQPGDQLRNIDGTTVIIDDLERRDTNRNYDEVNRLLGGASTRQEALDLLDYIRGELVAGRGL